MYIFIPLGLGFMISKLIHFILIKYFKINFSKNFSKYVLEVGFSVTCILLYLEYSFSFHFIKYLVLISIFVLIGIIDLKTTDVYLVTVLIGIAAGLITIIYEYYMGVNIMQYIYGALFGAGMILLVLLLTKGVGWGDLEVIFTAGLFLGLKNTLLMINLAVIMGALVSLSLLTAKKNKTNDMIPFVPFLTLSTIMISLINFNFTSIIVK